MAKLSDKLRSVGRSTNSRGIMHWCPGCNEAHVIWYARQPGSHGATWNWDADVERPTVTPSVKLYQYAGGQEFTVCHYFLKDGNIEFCSDSAHELRGTVVPLPDWPWAEGEYGGA